MLILDQAGPAEAFRISGICKEWIREFEIYWKNVCDREFGLFWLERSKCLNWRNHYIYVHRELHSFRDVQHISVIDSEDEVVYMKIKILIERIPTDGVFVDVLVKSVCDNISISLVDFDGIGGCSSLTFSPDTGTVIKEKKISEYPRKIVGEYFQCLTPCPGFGKEHHIAAFISGKKQISFYRKVDSHWETTGTVSDCMWVNGGKITPCIAFRDAGLYDIQVARVCLGLPVIAQAPDPCNEEGWKPIGWLRDNESDDEGSLDSDT